MNLIFQGGSCLLHTSTDRKWLPLYEALASDVRLTILEMLALEETNVKNIAEKLRLSPAITTMHVKKLEQAGLITTRRIRKGGGTHKLCTLISEDLIQIQLPSVAKTFRTYRETSVPIGHYAAIEVHPTCGLASHQRIIGQFDDPRYFFEPDRVHADILWIGRGYIEYRIPNYLLEKQALEEIEISIELGSEVQDYNDDWPSDIYFYLNHCLLGIWTCPGDFGSVRGRLNPKWWGKINQYGLLKVISVREDGTYIDGQKLSDTKLSDITIDRNQWTLKFEVPDYAEHVGGMTIYGRGFGNHEQDLVFRVYTKA
jgi:predicted transcriptional regulator